MSTTLEAAASSTSRGEVNIQPSFFTSSLFVDPFREDIEFLAENYKSAYEHARLSPDCQPFTLFKNIWCKYGWNLLHLKVLEPRGRDAYISVIYRLFLERALAEGTPLDRVVGIFALYTFWASQPSRSIPPVKTVKHVPIPIDSFETLLQIPQSLDLYTQPLRSYAEYNLNVLLKNNVFLVLPEQSLGSENPRHLPREVYHADVQDEVEPLVTTKKGGRPSKQALARKARFAFSSLDKWLDRSTYPLPDFLSDPAGAPAGVKALREERDSFDVSDEQLGPEYTSNTHILLSQRPTLSLEAYRTAKDDLLNSMNAKAEGPLIVASTKVLNRLQQIDAMAAERGLEVGTEGGELSGLERVQRASQISENNKKGLLGLLEGSGLQ